MGYNRKRVNSIKSKIMKGKRRPTVDTINSSRTMSDKEATPDGDRTSCRVTLTQMEKEETD